MNQKIDIKSNKMFYEIDELKKDEGLLSAIKNCIDAQKKIGLENLNQFDARQDGRYLVSQEALNEIILKNEDISDIRTHENITNCITFHTKNLDGSLIDQNVDALRLKANDLMIKKIKKLFGDSLDISIEVSGHFWYPKNGFMGWHTNLRKPGWRMYVNYAEEEGKSFFRYRDPQTGDVITCPDKQWNFRLFKIDPQLPFWHCVYSDINRFSLGYKIEIGDK